MGFKLLALPPQLQEVEPLTHSLLPRPQGLQLLLSGCDLLLLLLLLLCFEGVLLECLLQLLLQPELLLLLLLLGSLEFLLLFLLLLKGLALQQHRFKFRLQQLLLLLQFPLSQ